MQLYIDTVSTTIEVKNRSFMVVNKTAKRLISPRRVSSIAILTNVMLSSSAIKLAASSEIPIFYYDKIGNLIAQLRGPSYLKQSQLRYLQIQFMNSLKGKMWGIRQLELKTNLQIETLERYGRNVLKTQANLKVILASMKEKKELLSTFNLSKNKVINTIMGIEGGIARLYFQGVNLVLPEQYRFSKRSRQPAEDFFNASLNYIYGMTYGEITKAIHAAGLDTFVGALHRTVYKENLVFDCIEPFRPIVDRLLIDICKNKLLNQTHFKSVKNGFWLSKEGKKIIIEKYYDYLQQRILFKDKVKPIQFHIYEYAKDLKLQIKNFDKNVPDIL